MLRVFIIFLILDFFFKILVPFEILSHYPNIDSSHWPREHVQWNVDKVFREKLDLNGFDTF